MFNKDDISRPALWIVAGRIVGGVASFAIPAALVRVFDPALFGTYKQLFLIYATLFGLAQVGAAESLYYFVPRTNENPGQSVCNAIVTLAVVGFGCSAALFLARNDIAGWMGNPALTQFLPLLGVFLALTLVSAPFEIVMVARRQAAAAGFTYAASDFVRTALFAAPALAFGTLRGVLIGAALFGAVRVVAMLGYMSREFGRSFRVDIHLWHRQLAYALPFALAVGVDVLQGNLHQWLVATKFDATTFAIYAVGCLQIPLVDLICTSAANVMMVKLAGAAGDSRESAVTLWHDTIVRLASFMCPLACLLLLTAHDVIAFLFTNAYLASVPIFRIWLLMILPSVFVVDAVLRVYAQTRFLLVMNLIRLAIIAGLVGVFIDRFGLIGAVLVTLAGSAVVKVMGIIRIARLMDLRIADVLPWRRLAETVVLAVIPIAPALALERVLTGPPVVYVLLTGAAYSAMFAALVYAVRPSSSTTFAATALSRLRAIPKPEEL